MSYMDEIRALYDKAEQGMKDTSIEQGNTARGQATRRAAVSGRFNQPVQEWTYSDIEKNLAAALNTGLAGLAKEEAGSLMQARQTDLAEEQFNAEQAWREKESKKKATSNLLQSIFGLAGTVAPYVIPGAAPLAALSTGVNAINKSQNSSNDLTSMDNLYRNLGGNNSYKYTPRLDLANIYGQ